MRCNLTTDCITSFEYPKLVTTLDLSFDLNKSGTLTKTLIKHKRKHFVSYLMCEKMDYRSFVDTELGAGVDKSSLRQVGHQLSSIVLMANVTVTYLWL